ncbi:hypothetical protein PPERSA_11706 [Pseudocohnilembus persalinus]|uniref:Transmembrane protein n=1 Tax=Pseudocohnilembus persalinus TaxID=266149 RepID=A0A0V0Q789_PSEPJ|nr:hypothetical protein PPERSA_11706 [Pseudocohnilembus persalinus]|eukprot:KRW98080.1 hypothetical protein PPERSA_11706 [Pseudocohnilembus persalinus]
MGDPSIQCDSDFYKTVILPINISAIIILQFIIPGLILRQIKKMKDKQCLDNLQFIKVYGILYSEYKNEKYFWEFIIIIVNFNKEITVTLNNYFVNSIQQDQQSYQCSQFSEGLIKNKLQKNVSQRSLSQRQISAKCIIDGQQISDKKILQPSLMSQFKIQANNQ